MRTKVMLIVATVAVLLIGSAAIASNMGFKITVPLVSTTSKVISLPYYNSYATAQLLRNDINTAISSTATVYNYNGTLWQRYAGGGVGQVNFPIVPGDGYMVLPAASGNWTVVGSHNPGVAISLTNSVSKVISVPYHTTASTAQLLRNEINTALSSTATVYSYNGTLWQRYAGGGVGQVNFAITRGVGYMVTPAASGTWTPAHY